MRGGWAKPELHEDGGGRGNYTTVSRCSAAEAKEGSNKIEAGSQKEVLYGLFRRVSTYGKL